jgi:hypothetical protein
LNSGEVTKSPEAEMWRDRDAITTTALTLFSEGRLVVVVVVVAAVTAVEAVVADRNDVDIDESGVQVVVDIEVVELSGVCNEVESGLPGC